METQTALRRARRTGWILIGFQLAGMLAYSTFEYSRYALTQDFAAYSQAWWAIAHGNLDPWSTVLATVFWRNNAEFAMWPLALLYYVYPHSLTLLWVQDIAVAATEAVTFGWILEVIGRRRPQTADRRGSVLALATVVVMLLDPWCYETIAFDFHFEVFAALFATLVGWDLWAGRTRRLWIWVPLALASDAVGGLCVLGVGLSGVLAGRGTRRTGLLLTATGLGWVLFIGAIGGAGVGGRLFSAGYGYLAGPGHGHLGALGIVTGALLHPGTVAHVLVLRLPMLLLFLVVVGLIGVISPWGLGPALVVFAPGVLYVNSNFLNVGESFQSWPALPFVLTGSVMVLLRMRASGALARRAALATGAVWAVVVGLIAFALPAVLSARVVIGARAAAELGRVQPRIPVHAEVIASHGVVGRFADRGFTYSYPDYGFLGPPTMTYPVTRSLVVFVLTPGQGQGDLPLATGEAAVAFVRGRLHAHLLDARNGVYVLTWSPPPGTTAVTLP